MSAHINQIVQKTRALADLQADLDRATGDERQQLTRRYRQTSEEREGLLLAAIWAGVDPDLIQWAIGMNDTRARVQMQHAIAHIAAAAILEVG